MIKNSFYRKLQLSFIAFLILPIFLISLFNYSIYKNIILDKIKLNNESVLNVLSNDINKLFNDVFYVTQLLVTDTDVINGLTELQRSSAINSFEDFKSFGDLVGVLTTSDMKAFNVNVDMFIINNEGFIFPSMRNLKSVSHLREDWLQFNGSINEEPSEYFQWVGQVNSENEHSSRSIYFSKVIDDPRTGQQLGFLNTAIAEDYFSNLFEQITVGSVVIVDEEDNVIYGLNEHSSIENGAFIKNEALLSPVDWKLIYYTSERQLIEELRKTFYQSLSIIALFIILFIAISIALANKMHSPLKQLQHVTQTYGEGNRSIRYDVKGNDEINRLGKMMNTTFDQVELLITRIEQEKEKIKELEISALFSQIRPHFLMNTLNSVRCNLILVEDVYHSNKIYSLMLLLRKYLNANKPSTLKNECELLEHYVDIMSMRNGIEFNLEFLIPKHLQSMYIPFLTLQPIVENAIIHGFSYGEKGTISICVHEREDLIIIEVTDDGRGLKAEQCRKVNRRIDNNSIDGDEEHQPIGLANVSQRLHLIYGQRANIKVESEEGYGTTVEIIIPFVN